MWWLALRPLEADCPATNRQPHEEGAAVGGRACAPAWPEGRGVAVDGGAAARSDARSNTPSAAPAAAPSDGSSDGSSEGAAEGAADEPIGQAGLSFLPLPASGPVAADRRLLGWQLLRFTPRVAEMEDAVLAEVSASLRLFKGLAALAGQVQALADEAGWGCLGQAPTAGGALALCRHGGGLAGGAEWRAVIDRLPLHTVSALAEQEATLSQLGCRTLGDVRRLPRPGLARRFGARLLDALDEVYGTRPMSHAWITLPEIFDDTLELPGRVDNAAALLDGAQHLLQRLQAWLVARRAGVRAVVLRWRHDLARRAAGQGGELEVRSALPARDVSHLSRLLAEKLNQTQLAGPVGELGLSATEIELLPDAPESFWRDAAQAQSSRVQLLERLGARLGADKVCRPRLLDDHRPGWLQSWVPVESAGALREAAAGVRKRRAGPRGGGAEAAPAVASPLPHSGAALALPPPRFPLPGWMLEEPLGLAVVGHRPHYRGPLSLLAGPHRVRAGWWQAGGWVDRDHYVAASPGAGLLWIYRERPRLSADAAGGWFLQGFYG